MKLAGRNRIFSPLSIIKATNNGSFPLIANANSLACCESKCLPVYFNYMQALAANLRVGFAMSEKEA